MLLQQNSLNNFYSKLIEISLSTRDRHEVCASCQLLSVIYYMKSAVDKLKLLPLDFCGNLFYVFVPKLS